MTQPVDALVQQWANTATVRAAGPRLLSVQVAYAAVPVALVETAHDELELRAHWTAPPELAADPDRLNALATRTTFARAGQLRCTAVGAAIDIAYPVHRDGLTRNKFYDAAAEVAKAAVMIDESVRGAQTTAVANPETSAAQPPVPEPQPVAIDEPEPTPEPVAVDEPTAAQPVMYSPPSQDFESQRQSEPAPVEPAPVETPRVDAPVETPQVYSPPVQQPPAQSAPQSAPQTAPQWAPTHTVPAGGVPAWAAPDPAQPPVTQLPPGLPVRLVERQGGWARIDTENGWSAWVDGRPLPDPPSA